MQITTSFHTINISDKIIKVAFAAFCCIIFFTKLSAQDHQQFDSLVTGQIFPTIHLSSALNKKQTQALSTKHIRLITFNLSDTNTPTSSAIDKYKDWGIVMINVKTKKADLLQTNFLLDEQGFIIAKNLSTEMLDEVVAVYLRKRDYNIVDLSPK